MWVFFFRNWQAVIGVTVAVLLSLAVIVATHQRDTARAGWDAEKQAHQQTVANYRAASEQAQASAHAAAVEQEARQNAVTERVNQDAQVAIADAQHRADVFIAANRVRPATAADSGDPRDTRMPQTADATQGGDRSGQNALVAVTADDVKVCTENYERLLAAHNWVLSLNGSVP